ncbi:hypothetical protein HFO10_07295 [Rhizobium laguerreae]|uniref:hypothetical protein n=1 Tax=Rhizobium laguerreae TaxID=1076926 RepID=UPI001C904FA3|nr:hypothetical protein [Rhizobium laguerreae]MBY3295771.1 hypothetical protein [Rhizobium laguerreae]
MTKEEFELEARLSAIEYMISHTLKCVYAINDVSAQALDTADAQAADRIQSLTIEGADAAAADVFTDEMGRHVISMIKAAREMYGK